MLLEIIGFSDYFVENTTFELLALLVFEEKELSMLKAEALPCVRNKKEKGYFFKHNVWKT